MKHKKVLFQRLILTSMAFFAFTTVSLAQISGTVKDANGEPVIGASVIQKGTTKGVVTDINGIFNINVDPGTVLKFSSVGYNDVEQTAENGMTVSMSEGAQQIDDVVVVGFGTQKKVNLTGSVSSVSGDVMAKRPVTNPVTMLQGMAPGVRISQGLGQPGSESISIRVRGQGTFSTAGSDPLILINGVPGSMTNLDPNMIESVSILKDAASASIYGARAANGVILITTKQGTKDKATISYNNNFAWHSPTKMFNVVTNSVEYMELYNTAKQNSGQAPFYTQQNINDYRNNVGNEQYPNFDWLDYMFNTAFAQNHNLSAAGSTGKLTYNVGLNFMDQNGTLRGFNYKKYNATIDMSAKINNFISIGSYSNLMMGDRVQTRQSQDDALLSTLSQAPTYMPWLPNDGSGIRKYTNSAYNESHNKNMAAIIDVGALNKNRQFDVNSQIWLDIQILKGLKWYTKGAGRMLQSRTTDWRGAPTPLYLYQKDATGQYPRSGELDKGGVGFSDSQDIRFYTNLYSYLQYDVNTENKYHNFRLMVGYNQESEIYNSLSAYRKDYPFELKVINAGGTTGWTNSGSEEAWAIQSVFGRFNYNFRERYLFEANARYDGTSRISKDYRWGFFPSFSAAWRITEEQFIKDANIESWLSNAKIRASWGQLGNQNIGLYPYQALINTVNSYPFDKSTETLAYIQTNANNNKIKWETTTTTNIGVDLILLKNRLGFTFEWFDKTTSDILRTQQVSTLLGLGAPTVNKGQLKNQGIEMAINWRDVIYAGTNKEFQYNVGVNLTSISNKLTKFGIKEISGYSLFEEGIPYGTYYMLDCIGVFADQNEVNTSPKQFNDDTQPGDLKYRDANGNGKIDNDDRVKIDGRFPTFEYSIIGGINWLGFDFTLIGSGVQGQKFYTDGWGVQPFRQGSSPTKEYLAEMWTPEHPNGAKNPKLYFDDLGGNKNTRSNSWFLKDASYFRLRNLTVGYTLPKVWTEKVKMNRLRIYFSGDNLLTFTKSNGLLDPERSGDGRAAQYPQNKIVSFGVNVEF